jgi:hypothetical protein
LRHCARSSAPSFRWALRHDDAGPGADLIRSQFEFCADPLKDRKALSARAKRTNACASPSAAEELACYVRTINSRLGEMAGVGRANRERALSGRYVVSVERWVEAIQDPQQPVACRSAMAAARHLATGEGRLLDLLAWRDLTPKNVVASQFAPDQAVKVTSRILEQRNPWGGVPGCIYYGTPRAATARCFLSPTSSRAIARPALRCVPRGPTKKTWKARARRPNRST